MSKLVCGAGFNDANYAVTKEVSGADGRKQTWMCPYYRVWKRMIDRCYNANRTVKNRTYAGCSVCSDWLVFSKFKAWMERQDWGGKVLDKDIILPGNKVYCPEYCAFICSDLNVFLNRNERSSGALPTGVSRTKNGLRFQAYCRNPFSRTREYLGSYDEAFSAHWAWKRKKNELACMYADMQLDHRVESALRARYASHD